MQLLYISLLGKEAVIKSGKLPPDYYRAVRDFYMSRRDSLIRDGKIDRDILDDYNLDDIDLNEEVEQNRFYKRGAEDVKVKLDDANQQEAAPPSRLDFVVPIPSDGDGGAQRKRKANPNAVM